MQIKTAMVKKEQKVVEITEDELINKCATVCKDLIGELYDIDEDAEAEFVGNLLTLYSALMIDSIFNFEENSESEDK